MKAFFCMLLSAGLLLACADDKGPAEGQAQEAPAASAAATADPGPGEEEAARNRPETDAFIGARPANQPPQSGQALTLKAQGGLAKAGSEACIEVKVQGFNNLLSMQYTMSWDPQILTYKGVVKPGLPNLGNQNFGAHRTAEGLLTFVWIDGSLRGVTLPDESTIFAVCFEVKGKAGQSSVFRFIESPTPFESVNLAEELVAIKPLEGRLTVE